MLGTSSTSEINVIPLESLFLGYEITNKVLR